MWRLREKRRSVTRILEKPVVSENELAFCPNHLAISRQIQNYRI